MNLIPYGKQYIDKNDIRLVAKSLRNSLITTGKYVINFEKKIQNYLNCKFATTCNSGTSAIYLALQAIGIKKNDILIMPSINFVASYNIAKLFGAKVYLADVNKYNGQMAPSNVLEVCKKFKINKVKAIITMYNTGYPENVENFKSFKEKFGAYIIEDACHAFGSEYILKNKRYKVGSCAHSDISTFSLHPLKTITTGEGGIVTTNSKYLDSKIKKLRSHGILKNNNYHWKYDVLYAGLNFRLNDFQCALGISQLKKIKKFISYRNKIANKYLKKLNLVNDIKCPNLNKNYISSNHLFLINLKKPNILKKEKLIKYMLKSKIILQYHYIPLYKFKFFSDKYLGKNAEIYYKSTISLPIYYGLKAKEQNLIINKIKIFFKRK